MSQLRAELLKIKNLKLLYIVSIICWLICFLLFFQYTLNPNSGIVEAELYQAHNNATFFLAVFVVLLSNIWATLTGSYIGAYEYSQSSIILTVSNSGRYKTTLWKLVAYAVVVLANIVIGYCLGFLSATLCFGIQKIGISFSQIAFQIFNTFLVSLCIGILAMTVSMLLKHFFAAIACLFVVLFGAMFLPGNLAVLFYILSPYAYISANTEAIYANIAHLDNFALVNSNWIPYWIGVLLLLLWIPLLLSTQLLIRRHEQF